MPPNKFVGDEEEGDAIIRALDRALEEGKKKRAAEHVGGEKPKDEDDGEPTASPP